MNFQVKRTESDCCYSQSDLTSNISRLSLQQQNTSPRTRPISSMDEQWKKSSSNSGWKTSSSSLNSKKTESWKMSGKPRHAQLKQLVDDDPRPQRQSAPPSTLNSPWQPKKPLPQEPMIEPFNLVYQNPPGPIHDTTAPFHISGPMMTQPPIFNQTNNTAPMAHSPYHPPQTNIPAYTSDDMVCPPSNPPVMILPTTTYPPPLASNNIDYDYQQQEYPNYINSSNAPPLPLISDQLSMYPPSPPAMSQVPSSTTALPMQDYPPQTTPALINSPSKPPTQPNVDKTKKKEKPEKKIRQITVQSINIEHRVWIDVLPSETGLSLAEKIHIIATFRTRKIVSITTASGRKIPLDNRPVFGSWMDMENFVDGERWAVEWRENDRSVVDRFFSKVVQASGGRRKDHVAKEKE